MYATIRVLFVLLAIVLFAGGAWAGSVPQLGNETNLVIAVVDGSTDQNTAIEPSEGKAGAADDEITITEEGQNKLPNTPKSALTHLRYPKSPGNTQEVLEVRPTCTARSTKRGTTKHSSELIAAAHPREVSWGWAVPSTAGGRAGELAETSTKLAARATAISGTSFRH